MQEIRAQDEAAAGSISLPDGRRLCHLSVGPEDGALVIYLHGAIGSPQTACPELEAVTDALRIRYVMVGRPGFGGSDPAAGRTLLGFAHDVAALADALGHERFAVVGVSAGGPYALACAHELPVRVAAAAVVSSMPPGACPSAGLPLPARLGLRALYAHPRTCTRTADALLGLVHRHPQAVARVLRAGAAPADKRMIAEAEASEGAAVRFLAAAAGGVGGMIEDYLVCARPWGFAARDVRGRVHLWHGVQDPIVPVDHAVHLAATLPNVQAALHADEGHFFYRRHLREILGDLASAVTPLTAGVPEEARERAA